MKKNRNSFFTFCIAIFLSGSAVAQNINTIAGTGVPGTSIDGIPATAAALNGPSPIFFDGGGNMYFGDALNNCIKKVNTSGIITTIAGMGAAGFGGDGGPATAAHLNNPSGIAIDRSGNIYISDEGNQRVRMINTSGIITTIAGNGFTGYSGDGGLASSPSTEFHNPYGLSFDSFGNLYIADQYNHRVRKIDHTTGIISSVVGNGTSGYLGDGVAASTTEISFPNYVYVDPANNLFITDNGNHRIRKVNTSGIINTIAGNGIGGYSGDGVAATATEIFFPAGLKTDATGNLLFCDYSNNRVRKVNTAGIISTIAGNGILGYGGDGGPATSASTQFNQPLDLAINAFGDIALTDYGNNRVRLIWHANRPPSFINGPVQSLHICTTETPTIISGLLAITDSDAGQTETWSVVIPPAHGTVVGSYTATSTGSTITPGIMTYTAASGYTGTDLFAVQVSDGFATTTTTISVTVDATPYAGVISGVDSICPGSSVLLSETVSGGIWSTGSYTLSDVSSSGMATGLIPGKDTIIYTVIDACGIVSAIFPFTIRSYEECHTGVNTISAATTLGISVYPNPATNILTITAPSGIENIEIINIIGQLITTSGATLSNQSTINISSLMPGIYFIKVNDSYVRQFVKQ